MFTELSWQGKFRHQKYSVWSTTTTKKISWFSLKQLHLWLLSHHWTGNPTIWTKELFISNSAFATSFKCNLFWLISCIHKHCFWMLEVTSIFRLFLLLAQLNLSGCFSTRRCCPIIHFANDKFHEKYRCKGLAIVIMPNSHVSPVCSSPGWYRFKGMCGIRLLFPRVNAQLSPCQALNNTVEKSRKNKPALSSYQVSYLRHLDAGYQTQAIPATRSVSIRAAHHMYCAFKV